MDQVIFCAHLYPWGGGKEHENATAFTCLLYIVFGAMVSLYRHTKNGHHFESLSGEAYPSILQDAKIPLLSRQVCTQSNVYGSKLTQQMICAGMLAGGVDTCDGDSGGPLQCKNALTGTWKLWGITSWGFGCAQPNAPGVYAKVTEYLQWIERKRSSETC